MAKRQAGGPRSGVAAFVTLAVLLSLAVPSGTPFGEEPPAVEVVAGEKALADRIASAIRPGQGILLLSPYLRYGILPADGGRELRVTHVTPLRDPLGEEQFGNWKRAAPIPIDNATLGEGTFLARSGGVRLTVTGLAGIPELGGYDLVVLYPDFFLPLYENEVRGGMIDLSLKLYRTLVGKRGVGGTLLVVDPLSNPSFPLQWGYIAEFWKEVWRRPDAFRDAIPPRWGMRKDSEYLADFGQFDEAATLLDEAAPHFPNDGSLDFQSARLAFWGREVPAGIRFLNRAFRKDSRYLRAYAHFGSYLDSRGRTPEAETVYRAGLLLAPEDPPLNLALLKLLLERAEAAKGSDPAGARRDLREAMELRVPEERKREVRHMAERIGAGIPTAPP
ncbi:MAG TPA: hypothetical protein VF847_06560 [Candidatus Deferrimicrobiaceae bacterium]